MPLFRALHWDDAAARRRCYGRPHHLMQARPRRTTRRATTPQSGFVTLRAERCHERCAGTGRHACARAAAFVHKTRYRGVVSSLARVCRRCERPRAGGGGRRRLRRHRPTATATCCSRSKAWSSDFVRGMPWFAGYSSVMVNVSDIYAMGGRPLAVVDALWSDGIGRRATRCSRAWRRPRRRMACRSSAATATRAAIGAQLAVAILGRATQAADQFRCAARRRAGDGGRSARRFEEPYPFWNASVGAPAARLRADLELLPRARRETACAMRRRTSAWRARSAPR